MNLLLLLAKDDPHSTTIVESGALTLVLAKLNDKIQHEGRFLTRVEVAVDLLDQLALDNYNQKAIAAANGVSPLLRVLKAGLYKAGDVLCKLAAHPVNRRMIVQLGSIAPLLENYYKPGNDYMKETF